MKMIHALLAGFFVLGTAGGASAAEPTFPGASTVGLVPPAAMIASGRFSGFESRRGASILFSELPAVAYAGVLEKFTPDGLRRTGFVAEAPAVDWSLPGGYPAKLMRGTQTAQGTTYNKWILLAGSPGATAVVTVQVPENAGDAFPQATVEEALRTVAFRAPLGLDDKIGSLPFRVRDLAGFRPVGVMAGSTLMLTEGPNDIVAEASQPLVVVASSYGDGLPGTGDEQRRAFAQQAFSGIAGLTDLKAESETTGRSAGISWIRISGSATDTKAGASMYVSQTIRFDSRGYLRTVAMVRAGEKARMAARFHRLADSVSRRQ